MALAGPALHASISHAAPAAFARTGQDFNTGSIRRELERHVAGGLTVVGRYFRRTPQVQMVPAIYVHHAVRAARCLAQSLAWNRRDREGRCWAIWNRVE